MVKHRAINDVVHHCLGSIQDAAHVDEPKSNKCALQRVQKTLRMSSDPNHINKCLVSIEDTPVFFFWL